ncbi:MAG: lytic murein transglycosylase [Aestuariivirga sp.]|uniref:lytic murein transglycosylase n=1 Tax=Aestuariivirga sp. TaxID=2650926 RepID=UPI0025C01161|nr:lytic transglycosylase domain-containing protein [Aestuariivirga sp.]MCA3560740.1 lytic murein transglycosylase [Aestuariivirga sp.]
MRRIVLCLFLMLGIAAPARAAPSCGKTGAGFEAWKASYAAEARAQGIGPEGLAALAGTSYATATIKADRGMHSFKLDLDAFMEKRGAATIIAQGKKKKAQHAALFKKIEKTYGVPAGPIIAIWGMETAFGAYMGRQNTISAVATLAYDCRRPDYFREQLIAALQLIDNGTLSASSTGAMHGEVGQTQFLPRNVLLYGSSLDGPGMDLNGKADALASTANFLRGHGWQPGLGYRPGEPNFVALQGWNAASVYQQALAIMGNEIDGN